MFSSIDFNVTGYTNAMSSKIVVGLNGDLYIYGLVSVGATSYTMLRKLDTTLVEQWIVVNPVDSPMYMFEVDPMDLFIYAVSINNGGMDLTMYDTTDGSIMFSYSTVGVSSTFAICK